MMSYIQGPDYVQGKPLSVTELAAQLGVSRATVASWADDDSFPYKPIPDKDGNPQWPPWDVPEIKKWIAGKIDSPYLKEDFLNSAWLADHLKVTRSAVSNWIARGILPDDLKPTYIHGIPYWETRQLQGIEEWHAGRPRRSVPARNPQDSLGKLLEYAQAAKRAAAVRGHQGISADDDAYWMGAAMAYQDIATLISRKIAK